MILNVRKDDKMAEIMVRSLVLGMVATNCYFVMNQETKEMLLIDPADDLEAIDQQVFKMGGRPVAILLTHGHFDHMMAAADGREKYQIPVYAHQLEQEVLEHLEYNLSGRWLNAYSMKADQLVSDGDVLELAGFQIQVLHTPGHTQGSSCYYLPEEGKLFSGDTLFAQSYGRTDFPTSSMGDMQSSIKRLLSTLPEETEVFPGHNESTSISIEKRYNPLA